jgi:hypothetical protein
MSQTIAAASEKPDPVGSRFLSKVFYVFAALAVVSVGLNIAGKWLGASIATVGHTVDQTVYEVVIGNNVMAVPANYIRFPGARTNGEARRLDLYLRWPDMRGYSDGDRDDFNHRDGSRRILFLTIDSRLMSRDMSGRLEPIYRRLIELPGAPAAAGLRKYNFSAASGYLNETLLVGEQPGIEPFVARCLGGVAGKDSLAACERDVHMGDELSLTYRFPEELLSEWRTLDKAVMARMDGFLRTAQ